MKRRITAKEAKLVLQEATKYINLDEIPLDNPIIYAYFQEGRTDGILMCESESTRYDLRQLQPSNMEELTAAMAMTMGIRLNHHIYWYVKKKYFPHLTYPILPLPQTIEDILATTRGLILYREQVNEIGEYLQRTDDESNPIYSRGIKILRKQLAEEAPHTIKRVFPQRFALHCYLLAYVKEYYPHCFNAKNT